MGSSGVAAAAAAAVAGGGALLCIASPACQLLSTSPPLHKRVHSRAHSQSAPAMFRMPEEVSVASP